MSRDNWCETKRSNFLHGSNWTEGIIKTLEKYICSEPDECRSIADLALTSGIVDLWKKDENPLSFIAWLSTTDDCSFEETCPKTISKNLSDIIGKTNISQALKESLYIACCLRDHFPWEKDAINNKLDSHGITYINLQGANLENKDLNGLRLPANLRKANLKGTNLAGTDLRGAYLNGSSVSREQLDSAIINHTTELPF